MDKHFPAAGTEAGQRIYTNTRRVVKQTLRNFLSNGRIDGSRMREHWFPQTKADVFISHSHGDTADAIKFAGWLKNTFDLDAFVDSCVWGYGDDLLKEIDDVHCFNHQTGTYSYEKRNGSTSHVHMMLSMALASMLDTTECIIFLNTPNSITPEEAVDKTLSPWLYYELGMTRLIRRRAKEEHRSQELMESFAKRAELQIAYPAELVGLTAISAAHLTDWSKEWSQTSRKHYPLDILYEITPE